MNNTSAVITVTLVIIAAIGLVVWGTSDHEKNDTRPQATTTQATSSDNSATPSIGEQDSWSDATLAGVEFSYPPEAEVSAEAGRAKVQILGEGNEPNTEVTDGITGYLYTVDTVNNSLAETAQMLFADQSATADAVIASSSQATFAEREGFSFELRNQLGSNNNYYVLPSEQSGKSLVVSYTASGPNATSFVNQFEAITQTARVTDDAESIDSGNASNGEQSTSNAQACQEAGGNWLAEHNECEIGNREWCERRGGTFNSCASACRHNSEAQGCAAVCVEVCSFEEVGS